MTPPKLTDYETAIKNTILTPRKPSWSMIGSTTNTPPSSQGLILSGCVVSLQPTYQLNCPGYLNLGIFKKLKTGYFKSDRFSVKINSVTE